VGGSGSGGEVHIGSSAQPVAVKFFATSFDVSGGAGSLLTEDSLNTLTNKSISGSANLLSNIGYSSLNLLGSIKNSDIASDAGITDSKLATITTPGKVNVSALTGSLSGSLLPSYSNNNGKYLSLVNGTLTWSTVEVPPAGVTSFNGQTGNISYSAPVTSVNGQTGAVSLSIPEAYTDADADARVSAGIAAVKAQPSGLASLDASGKLPTSQLPSLAITSTNVVSSQSAMLALSAQEGDVAIRTDNSKTYILADSDPTSLSSWKEITAGGAVTSVNGQSGTVSLSTTDVSEGSNQYFTASRAKSAAVSINIDDADQTKAPSLGVLKTYAVSKLSLSKSTWMGTNSITLTHDAATKDIDFVIFDNVSGERIFVDNVTWGAGNNSFTLTLPDGIVAGSWRVMYWVR